MFYLFDVDGTLTPIQENMPDDFKEFFLRFINDNSVYIVSGADYKRLVSQLGTEIIESVKAVYSNNGTVKTSNGSLVFDKVWEPSAYLMQFLEALIQSTKWTDFHGANFKMTPGKMKFTIIGHETPAEICDKYFDWDQKEKERKTICKLINDCYPEVDATLGGQVCVDIKPRNINKSQILDDSTEFSAVSKLRFFADAPYEGGDDYSLANRIGSEDIGNTSIVTDWKHTMRLLEETYHKPFRIR